MAGNEGADHPISSETRQAARNHAVFDGALRGEHTTSLPGGEGDTILGVLGYTDFHPAACMTSAIGRTSYLPFGRCPPKRIKPNPLAVTVADVLEKAG